MSLRPFGSSLVTIGGSETLGGGPSTGGLVRSNVRAPDAEYAVTSATAIVVFPLSALIGRLLLHSASALFSPRVRRSTRFAAFRDKRSPLSARPRQSHGPRERRPAALR